MGRIVSTKACVFELVTQTIRTLSIRISVGWLCPGGGGGGGTLIFSYISRLGSFFGFKILNFNIFWDFQKNEYFWGIKILWIFLGGHHKIGLYLGVISMHFMVFS